MKTLQILLILLLFFSSCTHKNNKKETDKFFHQFSKDHFDYEGTYVWAFNLMSSQQISTHTMYPDSITYTMTGKVYATNYTMKKLSYQKGENKWIGEDQNGIVYVLFFKEKTDSTISIYKHKCKNKGLKEALNFTYPKSDATKDHGWNVYALEGYLREDILPISGDFSNSENSISISDKNFKVNNKKIEKISFHTGERRWVGKHKNQYVQVFFKSLDQSDKVRLSINWFTDIQALYQTKYHTITDWEDYERK